MSETRVEKLKFLLDSATVWFMMIKSVCQLKLQKCTHQLRLENNNFTNVHVHNQTPSLPQSVTLVVTHPPSTKHDEIIE